VATTGQSIMNHNQVDINMLNPNEQEESLQYFGLERDPFTPTADPAFFHFTVEYERCIYGLKRSIDSRYGIVLVLGHYGTGKTSLMRNLFYHISRRSHLYNTAIIASPNPQWSSYILLEEILEQFGVPEPAKKTLNGYQKAFNNFLTSNRNRINTLIIDDAQNLIKSENIELLRLLQNIETPEHKLLNLVLFGQLELIPLVKQHPNFEQRINNAYRLNPLSYEDMCDLIAFRLRKAGLPADTQLFNEASLRAIFEFSNGIPREVVTICRNCLVIARRIGRKSIERAIVQYTIENITAKGLVMQ
jgi:general secretion pathway protein A